MLQAQLDPPDAQVSSAVWRVLFSGAVAEAPKPAEAPGLNRRNVMTVFDCFELLESAAEAAERALCQVLEEDQDLLVPEPRKAIRLDFVFNLLHFCWEHGFSPHQASKCAKLGLSVLDQSTLGPWLVMGETRKNLSQSESFGVLGLELMQLAAPERESRPVLSIGQANHITQFLTKTLYAHYSLYQAVFSIDQTERKLEKIVSLENAAIPLPTTSAKSTEQVEQEAADKKAAEDQAAYRKKRNEEEAELTDQLAKEDPEAERIVQAIVRKQEEAMRELFEQHYSEIEAKIAEIEVPS